LYFFTGLRGLDKAFTPVTPLSINQHSTLNIVNAPGFPDVLKLIVFI